MRCEVRLRWCVARTPETGRQKLELADVLPDFHPVEARVPGSMTLPPTLELPHHSHLRGIPSLAEADRNDPGKPRNRAELGPIGDSLVGADRECAEGDVLKRGHRLLLFKSQACRQKATSFPSRPNL